VPEANLHLTLAFLGSRSRADADAVAALLPALAGPLGVLTTAGALWLARKLQRVTFYARTLTVPARRDVGHADTSAGERSFSDLGCSACHRLELKTGRSDVAALGEQTIRPYTDMLLHDMGPGLADGRPDSLATGSEWRTPPLWGIGLVRTVNRHTRFLHDGRARSIEEAIRWHGGEAAAATQRSASCRNANART